MMNKSDIVLITFPFTDLSGSKLRPAVILAVGKKDLILCFITTQLSRKESTDVFLIPDNLNRLKREPLIKTNKITTLSKSLVKGRLGILDKDNVGQLNQKLKVVLGLNI